jgi:formylglycine-generating enzyme required for sulfatase activity
MVLIPAGEFLMGSKPADGIVGIQVGIDELPQQKVYLKTYFIDRYEVTNAQYYAYVRATGAYTPATWDPAQHPLGKKGVVWSYGTPPPGEERYPVTDTDWYDAKAYCQWAGKRLPTEAEWEKAARGTDGRQFPWGNDVDPRKANTMESGLQWARAVGSYPEDVSPYGVYDMIGNVAEWVDDWYHQYPGSTLKRGSFGHYPVLRGGSWATPVFPFGRVAARLPFEQLPPKSRNDHWHTGFDKGFRCAKDVLG